MSDHNLHSVAQKPEAPEWLIENIAEASKNARTMFFVLVGFLAYCLITIITISDRQIILNELVDLPIIDQKVSINGFFVTSPSLAIIIFIYFQLYLARIRGLILDLQTNYAFPGNRRLYPWIVNIAEEPEQGLIGKMQVLISWISLWWLLPLVLMFFGFYYVRRHEPILSYFVGMIPLIGTFVVIWFWCSFDSFEPGSSNRKHNLSQAQPLKRLLLVCSTSLIRNPGKICLAIVVLFYEAMLLFVILPGLTSVDFKKSEFTFLHNWIYVDLSYEDFTKRPDDLKLIGVHLEGANLKDAKLNNAKLMGAYIQSANLSEAELNGANLVGAYIQNTNLTNAKLQNATIKDANLQESILTGSQLKEANLEGSDLKKAKLWGANLLKAKLQAAVLEEAELDGACLYKAQMESANLSGSQLGGVCLKEAKLQFANLEGAEMRNADLQQANLEDANVIVQQLSTVATLHEAKLDHQLMKEIKESYSHLLKKPQNEISDLCRGDSLDSP